jgi:hypothetical protein
VYWAAAEHSWADEGRRRSETFATQSFATLSRAIEFLARGLAPFRRVKVRKDLEHRNGVGVVYVGCAGNRHKWPQHPLGNLYRIGKDGTRDGVLAKYRDHLTAMSDLADRLAELRAATRNGELPLGCWCELNVLCHADVLIEMLDAT